MEIYRALLEVLDYLFFATTERGKIYETGAFIHNYALCYGLKITSSSYYRKIQKPNYQEDLKQLNQLGIYLTPAYPLQISYRLTQWNTIQERYGFPKKDRNIGYPDWGFARVIKPESLFEFYLLVSNPLILEEVPPLEHLTNGKTGYLRLGKFLAKCRLSLTKAQNVTEKQGTFDAAFVNNQGQINNQKSQLLLNWRDIPIDPFVCDIYPATLPTRLITNPKFENSNYYFAEFGNNENIQLPANMSFVARSLNANTKRTKKGKK